MTRSADGRDDRREAQFDRGGRSDRGRRRPAARRRDACRPGPSRPSRPMAPWSFAACTSTTPPRSPSARSSDGSRSSAGGSTRRSSGSPSTRPRTRRPPTCGAPSTGTSTAAPTTSRSWPPCSAPTPWRRRAGRPSSPAPTRAYDDLSDEEKARCLSLRVVHTSRRRSACVNNDPSPEELALWRGRPSKEHPLVWTHQSGRRSLVLGATTSHVVGMDAGRGPGRSWTTSWPGRPPRAGLPTPVGGRRHGDLGQPGRVAPGLSVRRRLAPRHAPHDAARRRGHPVTAQRVAIVTGGGSGIGSGHQRTPGRRRQRGGHLRPGRCVRRGGGGQDRGLGRHRRRD